MLFKLLAQQNHFLWNGVELYRSQPNGTISSMNKYDEKKKTKPETKKKENKKPTTKKFELSKEQ